MLTPVEVETMVFRRGMRGYRVAEVQEFMSKITADYEFLYRENNQLKLKLEETQSKLDQYISKEETLRNALVLAQETAEEQVNSAKIKADIFVREAQLQAEQIRQQVKDEIQSELQRLAWLKSQADLFKCQFRTFLNALIEMADQNLDMKVVWEHIQKNNLAGNSETAATIREAAAAKEE